MGTLTETAYYTRKAINWAIVGIIAYFVLRFIFGIVWNVVLSVIPEKQIKPNNALGQLQKIEFPHLESSPSAAISYRLGTIDGTVPEASTTAHVYFMPKERPNFLDTTQAKALALKLGFSGEPKQKDKSLYQWIDSKNTLRKLEMDVVSNHLTLTYDYFSDIQLLSEKGFPQQGQIIDDVVDLLRRASLFPSDIESRKSKVTFLKLIGERMVETSDLSLANAIRVDFFRRAIGDSPTVTQNPKIGIISITISGSSNNSKKILELKWRYWPIEYKVFGRYGLIESMDAFDKLQSGEGFIASNPNNLTNVTIRRVYIGYYDSYESQLFLQPVFVFEGDEDFVAYVPAVAPPWAN